MSNKTGNPSINETLSQSKHLDGILGELALNIEGQLKKRYSSGMDGHKLCEELLIDFSSDNKKGTQSNAVYEDSLAQAIYTYKYFYGYAYEYSLMYRDVFDRIGTWDKEMVTPGLQVLSLGCGNGVDYYAARKELSNFKDRVAEGPDKYSWPAMRYIGIDYSPWDNCRINLKPQDMEHGSVYHFGSEYDVKKYLALDSGEAEVDGCTNASIIVLPKSILEFGDEEVGAVATWLETKLQSKHVFLCVCPPHTILTNGAQEKVLNSRTDQLLNALGNHYHQMQDEPILGESKDKPIKKIDWSDKLPGWRLRDWELSQSFYDAWKNFFGKSCCFRDRNNRIYPCIENKADKIKRGGEKSYLCPLDRDPITNGKYVCYRIYEFVRKD